MRKTDLKFAKEEGISEGYNEGHAEGFKKIVRKGYVNRRYIKNNWVK